MHTKSLRPETNRLCGGLSTSRTNRLCRTIQRRISRDRISVVALRRPAQSGEVARRAGIGVELPSYEHDGLLQDCERDCPAMGNATIPP